jgi:hypothetical protein
MIIRQLLVLSSAALVASTMAGYAGPCLTEIDHMQARIDARVEAVAPTGKSAPESSDALLHRQPTPGSIAAAEGRLGEILPETLAVVRAAMVRAREADRIGDKVVCERALVEV